MSDPLVPEGCPVLSLSRGLLGFTRARSIAPLAVAAGIALAGFGAADARAEAKAVRVLVLEPTGAKFSAADKSTFSGLIAAALGRRPEFDVLTTGDIARALDLAAQREMVGCVSDACLTNLAGALDAELVVFGDVNRLGGLLVFNLTLFDSTRQKSAGRVVVEAPRVEELPSRLRQGVDELTEKALADARLGKGAGAGKCPEGMVLIPAGELFVGAEPGEADPLLKDSIPSHHVVLPAFCLDVTEVSVEAYEACSKAGKCQRAPTTILFAGISEKNAQAYSTLCNGGKADRAKHPQNCVDWSMADRFCRSRGARLPTEAEWEYATRGPDGRRYPWGDDPPTANDLNACGAECVAWGKANSVELKGLYATDDGWVGTAPVGSFPAGDSRFGPKDVVGNVLEWVADWHGPYAAADATAPRGPEVGKKRVLRGGAFNAGTDSWLRPAFRFSAAPDQRSHAIGFRCARDVE